MVYAPLRGAHLPPLCNDQPPLSRVRGSKRRLHHIRLARNWSVEIGRPSTRSRCSRRDGFDDRGPYQPVRLGRAFPAKQGEVFPFERDRGEEETFELRTEAIRKIEHGLQMMLARIFDRDHSQAVVSFARLRSKIRLLDLEHTDRAARHDN